MIAKPLVYVVDDDVDLATSLSRLIARCGYASESFSSAADLLKVSAARPAHCVLTDVMMGHTDGFTLAEQLRESSPATAIIFMTAWPKTSAAVDAIRSFGGVDYLEKPIEEQRLLAGIAEGVEWSERRRAAQVRLGTLTAREWDVFKLLTRGLSNKMIAATLDIKPKTVEDHRAAIMAKTGSNGVAQLVELERAFQVPAHS
jgi:two-component system, LuxR family, response regulator FixJ